MNWDILIPVLVSVIGAVVSIVTARQQRKKLEAEASHIEAQGNSAIVGSAITLVAPLRAEIESLRADLDTERQARKQDAENCKQEISLRDTEIAILKRELNKLNRKLEAHASSIKKLKVDTDELALRTPPPLHGEDTPPLPTRSTFQDRPSDQPPDDAA